jgi:hypothetical protein
MKKQIQKLDATPSKRIFYSIIADYDLNRSICELVDNGLDVWVKGLYEGVIAADLISKQHLEQRNRIGLIVLDSTLEIAFKEYLVNESGQAYGNARLLSIFSVRNNVHAEIKKIVTIKNDIWKKIDHYYRLRCQLVHEKVTVGVTDEQFQDYRNVVEGVLKKLFKLKFD